MKPTIKFYEVFDEEEKALRRYLSGKFTAVFTTKSIQESKEEFPLSSIICIRTQSAIPFSWINNLDAVFTRSEGFDHLQKFLKETNAPVECGYLAEYCARAVAEQAIFTVMMLLRKMKRQMKNFDIFCREGMTGAECRGKNALIVGVGAIGCDIAEIAQGLGMNIKGFDPVKRSKTIKYISLEKGLAWADIIFCAADLNESSRGMLNYDTLSYAKKGAILANVSRGEITPLKDLKRLLAQKILGGIGLDVFPSEGKIADYLRGSGKSDENTKIILELKNNDNVIFTPHNAFNTKEALERKSKQTIEALNYYLKHKRFPNRLENKRG